MSYTLTDSQLEAQKCLDTCDRCFIEKSMRSGKTLTLLDYAVKNKYKKVLWIVPDINIRDNSLPEEIKKWKLSKKISVYPVHYNSIHLYENTKWDMLVMDEIQKITPKNYKSISTIVAKKTVAMTGTISNKIEKQRLLDSLKLKFVYKFTVDDAVIAGSVADYNILITRLPLCNIKNRLVTYKDKVTKEEKSFYTSDKMTYDNLSKTITNTSGKQKEFAAINRLRFINTLEQKVRFAKDYLNKNKNKRVLIFAHDRKTAEQISEYVYHGKTDRKYFDLFQEEKINHLVLVNKGSIGETYNNLDGCLLISVNSSNDFVQQRIFRTILFRENYTADINILISKDTIQENWIDLALYHLDQKKIYKIDESTEIACR